VFHEVPKRNSQVITPVPLSSEKELNQKGTESNSINFGMFYLKTL
jgi:hypothetical protein